MLIQIINISGKGFMTFKKPFEFAISNYEGMAVQIDGKNLDDEKSKSNGSGKSSLLETLTYGLFGELCRKNRYKDEIIHKKSKLAVIQVLLKANEINYKIERSIERKKTPNLRIWKEEEELLKNSTYQIKQIHLEKIIQMNFISFQCSVMFGRDFMSFPDLRPADRAKILTDIRGLDRFVEGSRKAGESAKALQSLVFELERSLENKTGKLTGIRSTSYRIPIDNFESERTACLISWEQDLSYKKKSLGEKRLEISNEINKIQEEIDKKEDHRDSLINSTTNRKELADIFANRQAEINTILFQRDSHKKIIDKLNAEIQKLTRSGEGPCPFCSQMVTGKYLQSKINQLGLEIMEENVKIDNLATQEKKVRELMKEDRASLIEMDQKIEELERIKNLISSLKIQLVKLSGNSIVTKLELEIQNLEDNIELKTNEFNPYIEMEEKRKNQIKELGAEIREINENKNNILTKKKYFDFWIDGFKKIRMMLFDSMISQLESLAQHYLSEYSSELNIVMTTERETRSGTIKDEFHIAIVDSNGDEVSYEMYSGGERQKIRLSISRALSQFIKDGCNVDFSIIAFDEPNDSLDDFGKETNFQTFEELAESGKVVLVTDHDESFKDKFDCSITIIKENGESTIHV